MKVWRRKIIESKDDDFGEQETLDKSDVAGKAPEEVTSFVDLSSNSGFPELATGIVAQVDATSKSENGVFDMLIHDEIESTAKGAPVIECVERGGAIPKHSGERVFSPRGAAQGTKSSTTSQLKNSTRKHGSSYKHLGSEYISLAGMGELVFKKLQNHEKKKMWIYKLKSGGKRVHPEKNIADMSKMILLKNNLGIVLSCTSWTPSEESPMNVSS